MILEIDDRNERKKIEFFNNVDLTLKYDAVGSVFSFSFYFNPDNPTHVFLAGVGRYQLVRIYENNELLLTGFILNYTFSSKSIKELVNISGYSVPGVLEDSQIPLNAYPLQSDGLTLRQIATKLLRPFKIIFEVDNSVANLMDKPFETTTAGATDTVKDYICSLATQLDIVVSHNEKGHLLFTKANTNSVPIISFTDTIPSYSASFSVNGQGMHSPITVLKQQEDDENAGQYVLRNIYVPDFTTAFRPKVVIQSSGDDTTTEKVAKAILANELKSIQLKVNLSTWIINSKIIKPNQTIEIQNKNLFIFEKTKMFIESVSFKGDEKGNTCELTCVLPECYNGKVPDRNIFL